MNEPAHPVPLLPRVLPVLVFTAVPLSAFLSFVVQPLMGKQLLPIYGGSLGTWLGCMVFFQVALLLGYSWAAWLVRKRLSLQVTATTVLAALAVVTFHLPSDHDDAPASILRVVWRLGLSSLPAMILLFSASPLLHGWMRRRGEEIPYYLYSVSNAGSLIAVLLYPFFIETKIGLSGQGVYWRALMIVAAALIVAAGFVLRRLSTDGTAQIETDASEPLRPGHMVLWLWLSALTCIGMLGATYHLASEVGSTPLAWVGPFSLYLFSFLVTFSGRWRPWMTNTAIVWLAISLTGFMLAKGFTASTVNFHTAWWLLSLTASGSIVGNALLYRLRPAQRFEQYYLVLALGGVLGGIASSAIIPYLFTRPVEFELASVALLTTGLLALTERRDLTTIVVMACVLGAPVLGLGLNQIGKEVPANGRLMHLRDLYGHVMVQTDERSVVLSSDTTKHGSQLIADAPARRRPTLYYTESTGVGRTIERLQAQRPSLRIGVIGLGAGTLAAYARASDVIDFWDIDPKILEIARNNFTFVKESAGKINLIVRDGRKAIEDSKADYDLIVIDAFSGDGVPFHLLTSEAMTLYFRHLSARNGLLVVHTSTRYSKYNPALDASVRPNGYYPIIEATARSIGHAAMDVNTDIADSLPDRDWDKTPTEYVIVGLPAQIKEIRAWFPSAEDNNRVQRQVTTFDVPLVDPDLVWTDDRNAALDTLDIGQFLFRP